MYHFWISDCLSNVLKFGLIFVFGPRGDGILRLTYGRKLKKKKKKKKKKKSPINEFIAQSQMNVYMY